MPKFSESSRANLAECHADLQRLFTAVIGHRDCTIVDGRRTFEEQQRNVARGVSKTFESKHLAQADGKAHAADVVPFPLPDWSAIERGLRALRTVDPKFETLRAYEFAGFVAGMAAALGISLRRGIDWDSDGDFSDHSFIDLPHYELDR